MAAAVGPALVRSTTQKGEPEQTMVAGTLSATLADLSAQDAQLWAGGRPPRSAGRLRSRGLRQGQARGGAAGPGVERPDAVLQPWSTPPARRRASVRACGASIGPPRASGQHRPMPDALRHNARVPPRTAVARPHLPAPVPAPAGPVSGRTGVSTEAQRGFEAAPSPGGARPERPQLGRQR